MIETQTVDVPFRLITTKRLRFPPSRCVLCLEPASASRSMEIVHETVQQGRRSTTTTSRTWKISGVPYCAKHWQASEELERLQMKRFSVGIGIGAVIGILLAVLVAVFTDLRLLSLGGALVYLGLPVALAFVGAVSGLMSTKKEQAKLTLGKRPIGLPVEPQVCRRVFSVPGSFSPSRHWAKKASSCADSSSATHRMP
jgi:hypothetical protein